jgi:hypothetical protein
VLIEVTLFGIVMEFNSIQSLNALCSIKVTKYDDCEVGSITVFGIIISPEILEVDFLTETFCVSVIIV